jgi:dihydroorotate dehydrogenase (fumarate)
VSEYSPARIDLTTTYLGIQLKNPLVVSASPLAKRVDLVRQIEEAGAAAVVMFSLFEEQINSQSQTVDPYLAHGAHSYGVLQRYLPDLSQYNLAPDAYLEHIRAVKQAVSIPVIGSLNGVSSGRWIEYARKIEQAGADALELNIYYLPTHLRLSSAEIEQTYLALVRDIRAQIRIPLAIKLSPFITALPDFARRLAETGANGLTLFNRFYQPDFDLETLKVKPGISLSRSADMLLPLHWIALLYKRVPVDFALSGGVYTARDVIKAIMVGANVAMLTSALLAEGIGLIAKLLSALEIWMDEHAYASIADMRGWMSQHLIAEPAAFERANYMKSLNAFDDLLS